MKFRLGGKSMPIEPSADDILLRQFLYEFLIYKDQNVNIISKFKHIFREGIPLAYVIDL